MDGAAGRQGLVCVPREATHHDRHDAGADPPGRPRRGRANPRRDGWRAADRSASRATCEAFFNHLESDPQFYFTQGADLLQGYRDLKVRIDAALPKLFSVFPKADYQVREVEAYRAQSAAGAYLPARVGGRVATRHLLREYLQPEGAAEIRHGDAVAARSIARASLPGLDRSRNSPACRSSVASAATTRHTPRAGRSMPNISARNSACSPTRTSGSAG